MSKMSLFLQTVLTTDGNTCVFPFSYNGTVYRECTTVGDNREGFWCSLQPDLPDDSDAWGYCNLNGNYVSHIHDKTCTLHCQRAGYNTKIILFYLDKVLHYL